MSILRKERRSEYVAWKRPRTTDLRSAGRVYKERRQRQERPPVRPGVAYVAGFVGALAFATLLMLAPINVAFGAMAAVVIAALIWAR